MSPNIFHPIDHQTEIEIFLVNKCMKCNNCTADLNIVSKEKSFSSEKFVSQLSPLVSNCKCPPPQIFRKRLLKKPKAKKQKIERKIRMG